VPRIFGSGCSSLPTLPTLTVNGNNNRKGLTAKSGDGLATAVRRLPTLTASDATAGPEDRGRVDRRGVKGGTLGNLAHAVKRVPTLAARDYRHPNSPASQAKRNAGKNRGQQLPNQIGGPLNPTWCEWFMGFPAGWTELEDSGTPSPRSRRKQSPAG